MLTEALVRRRIADVGLEAIAAALGISKGEVSKKVNGRAGWSIEQMCKLLDVLSIEAKLKGQKNAGEDYTELLERVLYQQLGEKFEE